MNVLFSFYFGMGLHAVSFFKQLILLYLCHSVYFTLCSRKWKINTQKGLHEVRIKENRCLTKIHVMWNSIMITSYCMISKNHRLLDQVTRISLFHSFFFCMKKLSCKKTQLVKGHGTPITKTDQSAEWSSVACWCLCMFQYANFWVLRC